MVGRLRKALLLLVILVSLVLGLWPCADNTEPVALVLYGFRIEPQPLGLLVVATFGCGVIAGLLGNLLATSWLVFRLKRLQKRLVILEGRKDTAGKLP